MLENHKIISYEDNIKDLPDYPSDAGYTAEQLKEMFDARGDKEIKEKHNALVDELVGVFEGIRKDAEEAEQSAKDYAEGLVKTHNAATDAHTDIRNLISELARRLSAVADSDDITLDQLSEIVSYIKNNREVIEVIMQEKVGKEEFAGHKDDVLAHSELFEDLANAMGLIYEEIKKDYVKNSDVVQEDKLGGYTEEEKKRPISTGVWEKNEKRLTSEVEVERGKTNSIADFERIEIAGKNLLNINAPMPDTEDPYSGGFLRGKIFDDNGNISNNSAACITDFILAPESGDIKFTFYDEATGVRKNMLGRRVFGYDENKNLIGLIASSANGAVTCDESVIYVRLQFPTVAVDSQGMVFYSTNAPDGYEPYIEPTIEYKGVIKTESMPKEFGEAVDRVTVLEGQVKELGNQTEVDDVEYIQKPNLYNGEWELGRYDYTTGAEVSTTARIRNAEPIALDATKAYNIYLKDDYNDTLYLFKYDANMKFLGYISQGITTTRGIHFDGVAYINFFLQTWGTDHPDEKPQVMVWESKSDAHYVEWLEYGERGKYYKPNLLIKGEQMGDATLSIDKARFDGSFNYIAYSNILGHANMINTAEHYLWCAKRDFTSIKGDVEVTSDGKLVMCHDNGFTFDSEGKITGFNKDNATTIRSLTEAECLALQHANTGYHICGFETFIKICKKYGKIAFVTVRQPATSEDTTYRAELVSEMMRILKKYGMVKRCIINSFNYKTLSDVREADPTIMLSQVLALDVALTNAAIDRAVALGNMIICAFNFSSVNEEGIENKIDQSVIEYAIEKDIRVYEAIICSADMIDTLMECGITGAQMMVEPVFE